MPTILCCLLIFIVWLSYQRSKSDKAAKKESDAFWKREQESNLTRKKDISSLDYLTINYEELPFDEHANDEIQYVQQQLYKLKDQKIVNLSNQSNTDLKLTYGAANINELSLYDQNFTLLIRNLNKWGALLYKNNQYAEAKTVLNYAITCGSNISASFLTLAEIYSKENNQNNLNDLLLKAQQLTTPLKDSLIAKLTAIIEKASHIEE